MTLVEFVTGLGTIAVILLGAFKYLFQQMRTDRKFMEDRLTKVLDDYNQSLRTNTQALVELYTWLKTKNGSK